MSTSCNKVWVKRIFSAIYKAAIKSTSLNNERLGNESNQDESLLSSSFHPICSPSMTAWRVVIEKKTAESFLLIFLEFSERKYFLMTRVACLWSSRRVRSVEKCRENNVCLLRSVPAGQSQNVNPLRSLRFFLKWTMPTSKIDGHLSSRFTSKLPDLIVIH